MIGIGGRIGKNKEECESELDISLDEFYINNDTLRLVIQVSNFHIQKAGIHYPLELGFSREINKEKEIVYGAPISDLKKNKNYTINVRSIDMLGNESTSEFEFRTGKY